MTTEQKKYSHNPLQPRELVITESLSKAFL